MNNVNKIGDTFKSLRRNFGQDVEIMHDKVSLVDCRVGSLPPNAVGLEDCLSTWEGIAFLHLGLGKISSSLATLQRKTDDFERQGISSTDAV